MRQAVFVFGLALASAAGALVVAQETAAQDQALAANALDRWNRMSPAERERELAKLPPARAKLIRQRLRRYNAMSPQEQQALRERYQTFSELPPAKQQVVRQRLREFRQLPAPRRPIVHAEVERLRALPEAQRQAQLNSEEFRSHFSPQEQEIVRDLTQYLEK